MGKCQGSESIQKKRSVSSVHCSCLRHRDRGASSSPPADLLHCVERNGGKQHASKIQLETNLSLSSLCKVRQVLISCRKGFVSDSTLPETSFQFISCTRLPPPGTNPNSTLKSAASLTNTAVPLRATVCRPKELSQILLM